MVRFYLDNKIVAHKKVCSEYIAIYNAKHTPSDLQTIEYKNIQKGVEHCSDKIIEEKNRGLCSKFLLHYFVISGFKFNVLYLSAENNKGSPKVLRNTFRISSS